MNYKLYCDICGKEIENEYWSINIGGDKSKISKYFNACSIECLQKVVDKYDSVSAVNTFKYIECNKKK